MNISREPPCASFLYPWSQRYHDSDYIPSSIARQLPNADLNPFTPSFGVILPALSFIRGQGHEGKTENQ